MMATKRKRTNTTLKADIFDQLIADDIKKDIDIIRLFHDFGVQLTKKGKSYIGLCPFHDDKNPSLSVDPNQGIYNCFGCGESGNVFHLVQKMKGCSFREAMDYLKTWKSGVPVDLSLNIEDLEIPRDDEVIEAQQKSDNIIFPLNRKEPSTLENQETKEPKPTNAEEPNINLNDVVEEYHRNLLKNDNAINYLKARGIADNTIISDYKIGFCNGSLSGKLSEKQINYLKELGIFRDNGSEAFLNCLIFPIFDETKQAVGIYARTINDNSKVKHLYLKGNHKSVFNRSAVKVYPEQIILTECIIDAVSLLQLDIRNVLACYGVNGFTAEMKELIKANRVKEIVIAFDNDSAGRKAGEKLKDELVNDGFTVNCIYPKSKKDWNEELTSGITKDQILSLIKSAESYSQKKEDDLSFEIKGDTYYFTKDGLTYRVIGFKGNFTTELKLNFRCWRIENKDKTVSRVFNIYADRAPELFIRAISEEFAISQEIIKSHFDRMIEIFEEERERILDEKGKNFEKQVYILTPTEENQALDILTGSDVITDHLLTDTNKLGLVGETLNKQVCYLAIISRNWKRPLNICTLSTYGTGKSFLHDTMHKFVPDEDLKSYSRITKNDLYYREEDNAFVGKVLSVDELEGLGESLYSIRTLISSGVLSISYPSMDPVTGKLKNEENKVFGRPAVFCTGTSDDEIDAETKSRFLILTTDISNEQKFRIKQQQFHEMSLKGVQEKRLEEQIVRKHKNILRMLKSVNVVFPESWHKKLAHLESGGYTIRDNLSYLSIIASFVILGQFKRKIYTAEDNQGKFRVAEVTKEDIVNANHIMKGLFGKSLADMSPPQRHFFNVLCGFVNDQIKGKNLTPIDVTFYERNIREYSGLSAWHVNKYLNELVKLEYVAIANIERHNRKVYKLIVCEVGNDEDKYLSGLINPDHL